MNGTMHGNQAWKFLLEPGDAACTAMRGAIVHDPEDPASLVVRRLLHVLFGAIAVVVAAPIAILAAERARTATNQPARSGGYPARGHSGGQLPGDSNRMPKRLRCDSATPATVSVQSHRVHGAIDVANQNRHVDPVERGDTKPAECMGKIHRKA